MSITITAEQRNALYEILLDRISAIGDVWIAVCAGHYEVANRLALAYADELRFIAEDIGWGDDPPGDPIELTTPPEVLQRVLGRLRAARNGRARTPPAARESAPEPAGHRHLRRGARQPLRHRSLFASAARRGPAT